MTTAEFVRLARGPVERLFDALVDPARRERTMLLLLSGYAAVWSLYAAIAKSTQDIHPDMGEVVAWSREVTLGTPKHPPLSAWLVHAWFSVFPLEPWAYYLFAVILPTVALWIAWRVAARYLPADKRVVGVALLTLVPFYNLLAFKFDANTVLTPFWAATTWWFLRSFETRRAGWSVLAGIGAAAAMLGKYWSVVLLAALGIAALTDPRRGAYFRSPAPWLTIAVGAILLAPHLAWIVAHDFTPISYAMASRGTRSSQAILSVFNFTAGNLGYIALPTVLTLFAARPKLPAIGDTLWPSEPERRTVLVAFATPFVLSPLIALLMQVEIDPLWAVSAMTLFPVVLLSSPRVTMARGAAVGVLAVAIAMPLVLLAAAPVFAFLIPFKGVANYGTHYRIIAQAVERAWEESTDKPLRIVGSYYNVVNGTAFYLPSRPSTIDIVTPAQTPWVDEDRIKREGIAIVCPEPESACMQSMNAYIARYPAAKVEDVVLARHHLGMQDKPVRYKIVIVPPQAQ